MIKIRSIKVPFTVNNMNKFLATTAMLLAFSVNSGASTINPESLTVAGGLDGTLNVIAGGASQNFSGHFTTGDSNAQGGLAGHKADDWLINLSGSGQATATDFQFSVFRSGIFGLGLYGLTEIPYVYSLITEVTGDGFMGLGHVDLLSLSANLIQGTYLLHITGPNSPNVFGVDTDGYTGSVSVSSVPLPAAVWLFGSALLGFVTLSNRRKI